MHVLFILLLNQIFEIYDRINKISFVSLDKDLLSYIINLADIQGGASSGLPECCCTHCEGEDLTQLSTMRTSSDAKTQRRHTKGQGDSRHQRKVWITCVL